MTDTAIAPAMTQAEILTAFAEATVRIEEVIYIPGAFNFNAPSDAVIDFIEEVYDRADLREVCPALKHFDNHAESTETILELGASEEIAKLPGFFVKAATPMRSKGASGTQYYSWNAYHTYWLYCASEAEIAPKAVAWAREIEDAAATQAA